MKTVCCECNGTGDMFGGFACDWCGGSGIEPASYRELLGLLRETLKPRAYGIGSTLAERIEETISRARGGQS